MMHFGSWLQRFPSIAPCFSRSLDSASILGQNIVAEGCSLDSRQEQKGAVTWNQYRQEPGQGSKVNHPVTSPQGPTPFNNGSSATVTPTFSFLTYSNIEPINGLMNSLGQSPNCQLFLKMSSWTHLQFDKSRSTIIPTAEKL